MFTVVLISGCDRCGCPTQKDEYLCDRCLIRLLNRKVEELQSCEHLSTELKQRLLAQTQNRLQKVLDRQPTPQEKINA